MGKGRTPCCEKSKVKKGSWSQDEDLKLITFIQRHGHSNWRSLPKLAGLARCGKSCRLRWVNYLRPDVKRGSLSPDEEDTIIRLQTLLGNKWSKIASHLPGRTDNEIKNIWNTHLKKRSTNTNTTRDEEEEDNVLNETLSYDPSGIHGTSFDEPSLLHLWESLLLDQAVDNKLHDKFWSPSFDEPNIYGTLTNDGKQSSIVMEGDTSGFVASNCSWPLTNIGGSGQGLCDDDQQMTTSNHQIETNQKMDNNMESYLEIMAWPSSPTCSSFSGY